MNFPKNRFLSVAV